MPILQDIMIYDEETDQLKHISFSQAARACGFGVEGTAFAEHIGWEAARAVPGTIVQPVGVDNAVYAKVNKPAPTLLEIIEGVEAGIHLPVCITIARPFIEHLMMSCIACVSGRDTGATLFGPAGKSLHHTLPLSLFPLSHIRTSTLTLAPVLVFADMQISANTSVKTIEGEPQPSQIASFTTPVLCGGQLTLPLLLLVHRSLHVRNAPFRFEPYTHNFGSLPCMHTGTQYPTGNEYTLKKRAAYHCFPGSAMRRCHTKSVITKPQNVCVMRDIMCSGYVAGGNTRWFGAPSNNIFSGGSGPTSHATDAGVGGDMSKRLSFDDDNGGEYASMLAFASPLADEMASPRDQVISITDRLLPWEVNNNGAGGHKYFPGGTKGYAEYKKKWSLGSIHFGEDVRATENMSFMSQVSAANLNPAHAYTPKPPHKHLTINPLLGPQGAVNNGLCFLGPHRKYNPFAQNFFELVPGQGHFGPDAIPGDVRAMPKNTHQSTNSSYHSLSLTQCFCPLYHRPAGVAARASRSSRRATRWSRSRSPRTHSSLCARPTAPKMARGGR